MTASLHVQVQPVVAHHSPGQQLGLNILRLGASTCEACLQVLQTTPCTTAALQPCAQAGAPLSRQKGTSTNRAARTSRMLSSSTDSACVRGSGWLRTVSLTLWPLRPAAVSRMAPARQAELSYAWSMCGQAREGQVLATLHSATLAAPLNARTSQAGLDLLASSCWRPTLLSAGRSARQHRSKEGCTPAREGRRW